MRARLLGATMDVCAVANSQGPAVIDDVIRAAKVSRGTFYKHFDSLEQALAELGAQLADETVEGLRVCTRRWMIPFTGRLPGRN